jgi:hypothetical protein
MIAQKEARTNRDIAQSSLRVAQSAASDSRMMKTIGLLGVLFLPATFTAVSICTAYNHTEHLRANGRMNRADALAGTVGGKSLPARRRD